MLRFLAALRVVVLRGAVSGSAVSRGAVSRGAGLPLVLAIIGVLFVAPVSIAHADEAADAALRARIELIRKLPREDQQRLRAALVRFQRLSPERQKEIRSRAKRVGDVRLRELVGRNVKQLRRRQNSLDTERAEMVRLLGGSERFTALSPLQRKYLFSAGVREFQRHVRRELLDMGGPRMMEEFNRLPRDEKKQRLSRALKAVEERLLASETAQSRAAIVALPPGKQRKLRKKLLAEYRMTLIPGFVGYFEARVIGPYMRRSHAERQKIAERWAQRARWFEMRRRLDREIGVSRGTLDLLSEMRPEEWARIRDVYVRTGTEGLTPGERRLRLETEIRELHGRSAFRTPQSTREDRRKHERRRLRRMLNEGQRDSDGK